MDKLKYKPLWRPVSEVWEICRRHGVGDIYEFLGRAGCDRVVNFRVLKPGSVEVQIDELERALRERTEPEIARDPVGSNPMTSREEILLAAKVQGVVITMPQKEKQTRIESWFTERSRPPGKDQNYSCAPGH